MRAAHVAAPARAAGPEHTLATALTVALVEENRLLGQPAPTAPDQVWVGDITSLAPGGWALVLPGHLARCLLPAGGRLTPSRADADGTRAAGFGAGPDAAPTRAAYRARIAQAGAVSSFSRPENPYDNAYAEAGWSTLKTELLPHSTAFASLEEARLEVAHYLDTYFNLDRRHSALGYRFPHQFEHDLKSKLP